jgi:hypothetical protein
LIDLKTDSSDRTDWLGSTQLFNLPQTRAFVKGKPAESGNQPNRETSPDRQIQFLFCSVLFRAALPCRARD